VIIIAIILPLIYNSFGIEVSFDIQVFIRFQVEGISNEKLNENYPGLPWAWVPEVFRFLNNLVPRAMPVRGLGWHWLWGN
jgi:hypothetical protein